jgi:hypothetical protein
MPTVLIGQNGNEIRGTTRVGVTGCSKALSIKSHGRRGRTLRLVLHVPAAGKLKISGKGVRTSSKSVVGTELLTVTVHGRGKRKVKGRVVITFSPKNDVMQARSLRLGK